MSTYSTKIKNFFGFSEELENEETYNEDVESPTKKTQNGPLIKAFKSSLVNSQGQQRFIPSEIKIEEPRIYEDSLNIATHLREKKPVIINLKYLDNNTGKRLIDFICGTAYAINGHMLKIGENIFLFTPADVLIADTSEEKTDITKDVENHKKEVFFDPM